MTAEKIDYEQIEEWISAYSVCTDEKRKQQILTLIFIACKRLVRKLAYGLARRSSDPIDDIIQVGNIGLLKAIQRYKPEYQNIKSYIRYSIIREIKHYLRDKTDSVRTPRVILELTYRINKLSIEKLEKEGVKYSKEMIAKDLNISDEQLREVYENDRRHPVSFDQIQFQNDDITKKYEDSISDKSAYIEINKIALKEALDKLPEKLQFVIKSLYFDFVYQADLAKKMKTSQSHISRMQKRALQMLFDIITKDKDEGKD